MRVILYRPDIPQNTGNIIRTCSVTGTPLTLVRPLGFSTESEKLKRAGLDYFDPSLIDYIDDLESYLDNTTHPFFFFSRWAKTAYTEIEYTKESLLIFGSETKGLPPLFLKRWPSKFVRIPMVEGKRCLNLATSVGIALYEGLRQQGFSF